MKRYFLTLIFQFFCLTTIFGQWPYPFQDTALPIDSRANDLLKRLTFEEKSSLLLYKNPPIERLDIPEYNWWNEALHGVARAGKATVFPQAIALAATFDTALIYQVATAIANEARAKHIAAVKKGYRGQYAGLTFWTPNINLFRDPRWGRGQETYGEDPFLTAQMATAFITGLQGPNPKHLKTSACAKHFAVHSGPEATRHRFNVNPTETDLYDTYLPPFQAAVDAGVESVMCAYQRLYNQPCCANNFLLDTLLRQHWHFKGHIVSDCWALDDIWAKHHFTDDKVKAAALAAKAGVNLNCGHLYRYLPIAVKKGYLKKETIDSLLLPLLKTRIKLGILTRNDRSPYDSIGQDTVHCPTHKLLSKKAAVESIVLLKNNGVLPLNLKQLKTIFVTGPTAMDNLALLGNYNGFSGELTTFLEGIIASVDAGTRVNFSTGMLLTQSEGFSGFWQASEADVTIACIGNTRLLEGENGDAMLNQNGGDRKKIELPEGQIAFIKALRESSKNKPLIVVITGGSAVAIPQIAQWADAILFAWYPGEQGGAALADLLFGKVSPSGRLPVTFYQSTDDLPPFDDYNMQGRTYRFFPGKPLYEFGYGLSYTTFKYKDINVNIAQDTAYVEFLLSNEGTMESDEVVQLYVSETEQRDHRPIKSLKAFQRVHLAKNETKNITLTVPLKQLSYWDTKLKKYVLPQKPITFSIGSSSLDIRLEKKITLP